MFVAGGCGACLRAWLSAAVDERVALVLFGRAVPNAGLLVVNLVGCLAIGALAAALPVGAARTIVLVGLLGGFTTYSSYALVTVELAEAGRIAALAWQVGLHLAGGMAMVALGAWLVRALTGAGASG